MRTPHGQSADKLEKVMLLALWANALNEERSEKDNTLSNKFIFAGLGKPTYPINPQTVMSYLNYWEKLRDASIKWHECPYKLDDNAAINYGDPRGDKGPRGIMANVMSQWYESEVTPNQIIFTVGGIAGLRAIFDTFNAHFSDTPFYRIITPFPHYSAYSHNSLHRLHPIEVMNEPGYKVTAHALEESIKKAYKLAEIDHGVPKAVLFCNPSNPLGNIIDEHELIKIAEILRQYTDLLIVFDEAYAEMSFVKMASFIQKAPDLKSRVIILRSATKALSAAGERMAILIVFNEELLNEILNKNISYFIHAPRSAQIAYAETMKHFTEQDKERLIQYYSSKIDIVRKRLHTMGAELPDPSYIIEASFYIIADFSDLFGLELPDEYKRVSESTGFITTGEELAYYLMFNDNVMISPLSYFGLPDDSGLIRITCSANDEELRELMDRLENRLTYARLLKKDKLINQINHLLPELKIIDKHIYDIVDKKMNELDLSSDDCLILKKNNQVLQKLLSTCMVFL